LLESEIFEQDGRLGGAAVTGKVGGQAARVLAKCMLGQNTLDSMADPLGRALPRS
jgi:hypothetical protein